MSTPGEKFSFESALSPGADGSSAGDTHTSTSTETTPSPSPGDTQTTQGEQQVSTPDAGEAKGGLLEALTESGVVEVTEHGDDELVLSDSPTETTEEASATEETQPEASTEPESQEAQPSDSTPEGDTAETGEDSWPADHSDMPNGFKQRLAKLQSQRDEARAQAADQQQQLAQFEEPAQIIQDHGLPPEAVKRALFTMAAWNYGDAKTFLEAVQPMVDAAQQRLGLALPADLQQQVREGYITDAMARQLAQAKAEEAHTREQLNRQTATVERQQAEASARTIISAVTAWEARQKQADPDFARKEELVRHHSREIIMEAGRHPANETEAIQIADEALRRANASVERLVPKPAPKPEIPQGPTSSMSSAVPVSTKPKSLMEAAHLGLKRANAGSL